MSVTAISSAPVTGGVTIVRALPTWMINGVSKKLNDETSLPLPKWPLEHTEHAQENCYPCKDSTFYSRNRFSHRSFFQRLVKEINLTIYIYVHQCEQKYHFPLHTRQVGKTNTFAQIQDSILDARLQ